jgi:hypothetical protein
MELSQLEEDQSSISTDYDHVSDLVLPGSLNPSIKFWITRMNVLCFGHLVDSHFGTPFFAGNIYTVVSPRYNEWGTDYWLEQCLEGKKTLMRSVTDSQGIEFLIGSMVIKGEYLTHDERTWKKGGYVFQYYKLGQVVYHFTNLVIGTNLQLQTIPSKNSSKVWYFLPYSEHKKLMETISIRSDIDGLLEWPSRYLKQ